MRASWPPSRSRCRVGSLLASTRRGPAPSSGGKGPHRGQGPCRRPTRKKGPPARAPTTHDPSFAPATHRLGRHCWPPKKGSSLEWKLRSVRVQRGLHATLRARSAKISNDTLRFEVASPKPPSSRVRSRIISDAIGKRCARNKMTVLRVSCLPGIGPCSTRFESATRRDGRRLGRG